MKIKVAVFVVAMMGLVVVSGCTSQQAAPTGKIIIPDNTTLTSLGFPVDQVYENTSCNQMNLACNSREIWVDNLYGVITYTLATDEDEGKVSSAYLEIYGNALLFKEQIKNNPNMEYSDFNSTMGDKSYCYVMSDRSVDPAVSTYSCVVHRGKDLLWVTYITNVKERNFYDLEKAVNAAL